MEFNERFYKCLGHDLKELQKKYNNSQIFNRMNLLSRNLEPNLVHRIVHNWFNSSLLDKTAADKLAKDLSLALIKNKDGWAGEHCTDDIFILMYICLFIEHNKTIPSVGLFKDATLFGIEYTRLGLLISNLDYYYKLCKTFHGSKNIHINTLESFSAPFLHSTRSFKDLLEALSKQLIVVETAPFQYNISSMSIKRVLNSLLLKTDFNKSAQLSNLYLLNIPLI